MVMKWNWNRICKFEHTQMIDQIFVWEGGSLGKGIPVYTKFCHKIQTFNAKISQKYFMRSMSMPMINQSYPMFLYL